MGLKCLICALNFDCEQRKVTTRITKVSVKIFHIFCKYFSLSCDEAEIPFNFKREPLPFCERCKHGIIKLYHFDSTMDKMQKKIQFLIANMARYIVHSENTIIKKEHVIQSSSSISDPDKLSFTQSISSRFSLQGDEEYHRKILRYRSSIKKKYNPTVVLHQNYFLSTRKAMSHQNNNNMTAQSSSTSSYFPSTYKKDAGHLSEITDSIETLEPNCNAQGEKENQDARGNPSSSFSSCLAQVEVDQAGQVIWLQNFDLQLKNEISEPENQSVTDNNEDVDLFDGEVQQQHSPPSEAINDNDDEVVEVGNSADKMEIRENSHETAIRNKDGTKFGRHKRKTGYKKKLFIPKPPKPIVVETSLVCPVCHKNINPLGLQVKVVQFMAHLTETHPEVNVLNDFVDCGNGNLLCNGVWLFMKDDDHGFQCQFCGAHVTEDRSNLKKHIEENHPGLICETCGMTFRTGNALSSHKYKVHFAMTSSGGGGDGKFSCSFSSKIYYEKLDLTEEGGEEYQGYRCSACGHVGKDHPEMIRHISHHNQQGRRRDRKSERDYTATIVTPDGQFLYNGKWPYKEADGKFSCCTCNATFKHRQSATEHIKGVHEKPRQIICETCGKSYSYRKQFKDHLTTHYDLRPFKCPHCDHTSKTKGGLYSHFLQNHNTHTFPCDKCEKVYKTKLALYTHSKLHSDTSVTCTDCGRSFLTQKGLDNHLKCRHGAEKPYACSLCSIRFAQKHSVNRHIKRIHHEARSAAAVTVEADKNVPRKKRRRSAGEEEEDINSEQDSTSEVTEDEAEPDRDESNGEDEEEIG